MFVHVAYASVDPHAYMPSVEKLELSLHVANGGRTSLIGQLLTVSRLTIFQHVSNQEGLTGDSLPVTRMRAFHIISAEVTIKPAREHLSTAWELLI